MKFYFWKKSIALILIVSMVAPSVGLAYDSEAMAASHLNTKLLKNYESAVTASIIERYRNMPSQKQEKFRNKLVSFLEKKANQIENYSEKKFQRKLKKIPDQFKKMAQAYKNNPVSQESQEFVDALEVSPTEEIVVQKIEDKLLTKNSEDNAIISSLTAQVSKIRQSDLVTVIRKAAQNINDAESSNSKEALELAVAWAVKVLMTVSIIIGAVFVVLVLIAIFIIASQMRNQTAQPATIPASSSSQRDLNRAETRSQQGSNRSLRTTDSTLETRNADAPIPSKLNWEHEEETPMTKKIDIVILAGVPALAIVISLLLNFSPEWI